MLVFFRGVTPKKEGTRGKSHGARNEALIIGQGILTWAAKETDDGAEKQRFGGTSWQGQSKIVSRYHDIRSIICFIYTNIESCGIFFDGPFLFKYTLVSEV